MKKHCLFKLLVVTFLSLILLSCTKIKKTYNVNYFNSDINLIGESTIKEGEDYTFTFDYDFSYQNYALEVLVNGKVINSKNNIYIVENVKENLNIEVKKIIKNQYVISLIENDSLYEIYTYESNIVNTNDSFHFYLKFWGDVDLSNTKVMANTTLLSTNDKVTNYQSGITYYFQLDNIKQDVNIKIEDCLKLTWYTYKLDDQTYYQHSAYADLNISTSKIGNRFLGWSLEENNPDKIISLPYLNTTDQNEITLYAIYQLDNQNLDIPFISIKTNGKEIEKDNYIEVDISLSEKGYTITNSCYIRYRGNSTYTYPKKPYRIKFNNDTSLFGSSKYKDWVLLADYLDPSLIRNYTAFSLANYAKNLDFKHTLKHVELEIDGIYQGVYFLTDQIEESKNGRVEIKVDKLSSQKVPFLLERDKDGEGIEGVNFFKVGISTYNIKYPKDPTPQQFEYIYNYINNLYNLIKNHQIDEIKNLLDLPSLYDYVLINELMVNIDSNWKSGFLYKSLNGPLTFGPVWDFDWCFSTWTSLPSTDQHFNLENKYFLLKRDPLDFSFDWMIYLIQDQTIYLELLNNWAQLKSAYNSTLKDLENYFSYIEKSALRNYEKWYENDYGPNGKFNYQPINQNLFYDQYKYVVNSLQIRYENMNEKLTKDNFLEFFNEEFN